jgi:hypothetical protein
MIPGSDQNSRQEDTGKKIWGKNIRKSVLMFLPQIFLPVSWMRKSALAAQK